MDQSKFYAFKVPFVSEFNKTKGQEDKEQQVYSNINKNLSIIGIIDASGSMQRWWEWLANFWNACMPKENLTTITFSSQPMKCQTNVLSIHIGVHGGGSTEIVPAFELFEQEIQNIPMNHNITVIFISDGQDNNVRTLESRMNQKLKGNIQNRDINFICLGIQSQFPTSLSMSLRSLYHKGDPQVPAIYLIEYASEQAFFNKFETMKKYFYPALTLKVDRLVNLFPYDENLAKDVYEGQWICSYDKQVKLIHEGTLISLQGISDSDLEIGDAIDLFQSWVQNLQIKVMQNYPLSIQEAIRCVQIMLSIIDELNKKLGFDLLKIKSKELFEPNKPFHQRAKEQFVYKYGNKIQFFLDEIISLSKGVNPKQLSEFEQAKRLNLGTITGKHYQKALALKGITIAEFQIMKEEFIQIIDKCNFKKENEQGQERSVISLENQRDVLANRDNFIDALKYIKSQYDFADTFPLIGHGIFIKRKEGSQLNPWIIRVEQIAQQNKIIDSGYLIKNNYQVELQTGGDKKEIINCILPLYHKSDFDLQPILRSRIIKLLMTLMVQQNVDTLYEDTYLALLSSALGFLYSQPQSDWTKQTIDLIYQTTKIVYEGVPYFETFMEALIKNPSKAYLQKQEDYESFPAMAKAFIFIFYALFDSRPIDFEQQIEKLFIYAVHRFKATHGNDPIDYFTFQVEQKTETEILTKLIQKQKEYYYLNSFKSSLIQLIQEEIQQLTINCKLKIVIADHVFHPKDSIFSPEIIEKFYLSVTNKQFDTQRQLHIVYHTITKTDDQLFTDPVNYDNNDDIQLKLSEISLKSLTKLLSDKFIDNLTKEYLSRFTQIHKLIKPITEEELNQECQKLQLDRNLIVFNKKKGLTNNCCQAKDCPYYLKVLPDFKKHLQNWGSLIPEGFHEFVITQVSLTKTPVEILELSKKRWRNFPSSYNANDEHVLAYIELIKSSVPNPENLLQEKQQQINEHKKKHSQAKQFYKNKRQNKKK